MLYLICIMMSSVDLARYGEYRAKIKVSVDCDTKLGEAVDSSCIILTISYFCLFILLNFSCTHNCYAKKSSGKEKL